MAEGIGLKGAERLEFLARVNRSLEEVQKIIDKTRIPQPVHTVPHTYNDKYLLAEYLANSLVAGQLNALELLGLTKDHLQTIKEWSQTRSVTLRFQANHQCSFLRETSRVVASDVKHVTEIGRKGSGTSTKFTDTANYTIHEWFWKFEVRYELVVFQGNQVLDAIVLKTHRSECELMTSSDKTPYPVATEYGPFDVQITWLVQQLDAKLQPDSKIQRNNKNCRTPRRNPDTEAGLGYAINFSNWSGKLVEYFQGNVFQVQNDGKTDFTQIENVKIFVPVLPVLEPGAVEANPQTDVFVTSESLTKEQQSEVPGRVLNLADLAPLLQEHKLAITRALNQLAELFSADAGRLFVADYAQTVVLGRNLIDISQQYSMSIDFIESVLYEQFVSAIGKVVSPVDLEEYMEFHNLSLFRKHFLPRKFNIAVRRGDHDPEGEIAITNNRTSLGVYTISNRLSVETGQAKPMQFPINAATKITFNGDRFLHAWISHSFRGSETSISLNARARQFSGFIVLLGRVVSATLFDPKYAVLIRNKDDLSIPLNLEQIPSAGEFRDAIESLSPEQQAFAKAFRAMQLESTLFGICVIQIKPQLEKVLNLPDDSLTKEIRLTQDLIQLFTQYHIPTDLLSVPVSKASETEQTKLAIVKANVKVIFDMIEAAAQAQLEEARKKQEYELELQSERLRLERNTKFKKAAVMKKESGSKKRKCKSFSSAPAPVAASAPAPAAAPAPVNSSVPTPQPSVEAPAPASEPAPEEVKGPGAPETSDGGFDFTQVPSALDEQFERLDEDSAVRPCIITPSTNWNKQFKLGLLGSPAFTSLGVSEQQKERNVAFDLLDSITRSGVLSVDHAALHVVLATTHCFAQSVINTLIKDNVNPIDKIERSTLIVASTVHQTPIQDLVLPEVLPRVQETSPVLFQ